MILADKILNLRKKNGWSQEELAEKLNVTRQSISKWEGAIAIPDINKIIDMAKLFGVTTDYLLKDDINDTIYSNDDTDDKVKKIALPEANNYIEDSIVSGKRIALGVLLCILSPTVLILLSAVTEYYQSISEAVSTAIGISYIFISICIAVSIFIFNDSKMVKYKYLEKEKFELEYGVSSIVKEKKEKYLPKYNIGVVFSIATIILGVLPLVISGLFEANDFIVICMVVLLIALVAISVNILIRISTRKSAYDCLLSEDDFQYKAKEENEKSQKFSGFYWPIITAIYLAWSFLADAWKISWLVWPIAGLIFAGIQALLYSENKK